MRATTPSQFARLAFPIGIGDQAPFLDHGFNALRLSGSGELPPRGQPRLDEDRVGAIGRATLRTVPEFEQILLRMNPDGSRVLLKDVARVDLGAENYGTKARVNGNPSSAVAIKLSPSANALTTAAAVRARTASRGTRS